MKAVCAFFAFVALAVLPARAEMLNHADMQAELNGWGVRETIDWGKSPSKVDIIVNEAKAISEVPYLQSNGMLNPEISQTFINTNPHTVGIVIAQIASVMNIMDAYTNSKINKAQFTAFLELTNDYGETYRRAIFTFSFDRKLYNRINWNNFQMKKLPNVAHNFHFTPWERENFFGDE